MALEIRRRRIGAGERAIEIVDIIGRLDLPGAGNLRTTVQEILKEGCPRIAVNMAGCVEIHRETMGTFHSLGRACQRAGGGLVLFGATGDVFEYIRRFADRNLAPWQGDEATAIRSLGGEVEQEKPRSISDSESVVAALGTDTVFHAVFWKFPTLGGRGFVKFESVNGCLEYILTHPTHSLLVDVKLPTHDLAGLIRKIRTTPQLKKVGVFVIGPPSYKSTARALVEEGADDFVLFPFAGEEILAKLDGKLFFDKLKDIYGRFDIRTKAKEGR
jgi:CheY-like chemotaxis protein